MIKASASDSLRFSEAWQEQFQLLQAVLNQQGLPPTVDRRDRPRSEEGPEITVVLLAELEEIVSIFLEGNRKCPDGFLFVPVTSWVSRELSPSNSTMETLYVHQAITADTGGQTYLDVFTPPRRVTYLDNHLYAHVTREGRCEGETLGAFGLDTPTCSSLALNSRADDKLLTTIMCAAVGVAHPVTLGLCLAGKSPHHYPHHYPTVTIVQFTSRQVDKTHLQTTISDFLNSTLMKKYEKVVVKPFGSAWNSCKGVSYHGITNVTSVLEAVLHLVTLVDPGTGILVQSYHATFDPEVIPDQGRHSIHVENVQLGFRLRAIVARTPDNGACMSQVVCAIGDNTQPIGGERAVPTSLSLTLNKWGVRGREEQRAIYQATRDSCERLMLELIRQEAMLTAEERGGHGSQTDLVGMDVVLSQGEEGVVPVVIEVNAHDCLYHTTVLETMQPHIRGQAVTPLLHTMLHRSQMFLMAGRMVVVIGGGGYSKRHLWTDAREMGVKLVLVDSNPQHPASQSVDSFLHVDMTDHSQDEQHATTIVSLLRDSLPQGCKIDGVFTWWEDTIPLAARVGQALELRHAPTLQAAWNAKCKERTQNVLCEQREVPPHDLVPAVYASPVVRTGSLEDVPGAVSKVPLPAVMKLEFGSSAVAVKHVHSIQEALQHVRHVKNTLRHDQDHPGVGLGLGQSLILMPRLLGTEHDVDVVMYEGQLMVAFVSDNGPNRLPFCGETAAAMPSVLHKEQKHQLMWAAATCCRGLGLHTGVFNVEMMMTPCGPRLLEVNGRMGGFYLRHWIRLIYHVDILFMSLLCACGVRPVLTGSSSLEEDDDCSKDQLMGIMLYPSRHRQALSTTASPQRLQQLHQEGHIIFCQFEAEVEQNDNFFEEPFGNLAVQASSAGEARTKLINICVSLGLETETSILEILTDFVQLP